MIIRAGIGANAAVLAGEGYVQRDGGHLYDELRHSSDGDGPTGATTEKIETITMEGKPKGGTSFTVN